MLYAKKNTSTTTTIQYVGSPRPPFGEKRGHDEDFGWTHTFDKKAYKRILSVTLEIRANDVDYFYAMSPSEINLVFVDGNLLVRALRTSGR